MQELPSAYITRSPYWFRLSRRSVGLAARLGAPMFVAFPLALLCTLALSGCGTSSEAEPSPLSLQSPFRVVTTTGMVRDIVERIVGDKGHVVGLMGDGVDPHLYKPTANDVRQLARADVVFYSGLMLEGRMESALEQVKRRGRAVFAVTEGLDRSVLIYPDNAPGHPDPHVWMDVSLWRQCAQRVATLLEQLDPDNASHYRSNFATYAAELAELDAYVRDAIQSIPEPQRVLVTAHDAFAYFSRAYGIPVRSAQGISTESEPGVNDINALVDFLVERKIRAIFVETSVSQANLRAVLEGAASKGWEARIGGRLFSDAMGPEGTYEGTYIGMIDHNATTIAEALGGKVPERGFRGQLQRAANSNSSTAQP